VPVATFAVRAAAAVCLAILAAAATPRRASAADETCNPDETAVVVDTHAHRMHLCRRGADERTFVVALGENGAGKRRQGDNRTPLGRYPLGAPRRSRSFHMFVPVAYPTPAQARLGFTGSAIGIHGPPRGFGTLAQLAMLVRTDWTAGCIAVATDEEIEAVVDWIRKQGVRDVRLTP
jgi:L,D-peptidoglycan transpeptidase YkuD (ErfK/YbiS/YcfS/YnhG family)